MIDVVTAVIRNSTGHVLVQRRAPHREYGGMWETPGGKVDWNIDSTLMLALERELEEEVGVKNVSIDLDFLAITFMPPFCRAEFTTYFFNCALLRNEQPVIMEDQTDLGFYDLNWLIEDEMTPSLRMLKTYLNVTEKKV